MRISAMQEAKWAGVARMSMGDMKNRAAHVDGYQGRTTTEKWVSGNVRKKNKTPKKKKRACRKIFLL